MSKNIKKGFSLVEVMILFAFLSLILAASVPILSKKTVAVPRKTPHGVYICVANGNGVTEERYNSTNFLGSSNSATSCTFNVPKANEYKVELYSAGAGGTEYARIETRGSNSSSKIIDKAALGVYNTTRDILNLVGEEIAYTPTNIDFVRAFGGLTASLVTYTADAGKGGRAMFYYKSPADTICTNRENIEIPQVYRNKTDRMLDNYNGNNVSKQFDKYCRIKDPEYYTSHAWLASGLAAAYTHGGYRSIAQDGAVGGKGKRMGLDFKILPEEGGNVYYRTLDARYPFLIYMSDLLNNSYGHGYYAAVCDDQPENGALPWAPTSCSSGAPTRGIDRAHISTDGTTGGMERVNEYQIRSASTGGDAMGFAAFRIPIFTQAFEGDDGLIGKPDYTKNAGKHRTIQKTVATGGEGGTIGYQDKSTQDFTISQNFPDGPNILPQVYEYNYAWKAITGHPTKGNPQQGVDTTFYQSSQGVNASFSDQNNRTGSGWQYYLIYTGQSVPADNILPKAEIYSQLSMKEYHVGRNGGNGNHRTFHTTTLGTKCTMNVPQGGPVLKMDKAGDLQTISNYENSLNVSIQCVDNDNHTIFAQQLGGGQYNRTLTADSFKWTRQEGEDASSIIGKSKTIGPGLAMQMQYKKPRWSRVFNNINTLSNYSVGQGGNGTTLTDKCTAPKGSFVMQIYLGNSVLYDRSVYLEHDGRWPDDYYQCYPEPGTYRDIQELRDAGNAHYDIREATAGGPGAVIISW